MERNFTRPDLTMEERQMIMRGTTGQTGDDSDLLMTGRNQQSDLGTREQNKEIREVWKY